MLRGALPQPEKAVPLVSNQRNLVSCRSAQTPHDDILEEQQQ
jgi:ABC-type metal ion transport system substrate-binding protein